MQNAVGASAKPSEPVGIAPIDVCWAEALALGFVVTANGSATPVQKAWLNSDTCTDIDTCLIAQPTLRVASAESIHGQLAVAHSSGRSSQRSRAFGLNCGCKPGGGGLHALVKILRSQGMKATKSKARFLFQTMVPSYLCNEGLARARTTGNAGRENTVRKVRAVSASIILNLNNFACFFPGCGSRILTVLVAADVALRFCTSELGYKRADLKEAQLSRSIHVNAERQIFVLPTCGRKCFRNVIQAFCQGAFQQNRVDQRGH